MISILIGGVAGAVALNILHQAVKQFDPDAPPADLVREDALSKVLDKIGFTPPTGNKLFAAMMAADLVSNAAYYSMIGISKMIKLNYLLSHGKPSGALSPVR